MRIFWWLSVAIVAYWALSAAWFVAFPSARYLAVLARIGPELRETVRGADRLIAIVSALAWCAMTLGAAWFASFRRRNWGRWAFAALFLLREAIPLLVGVYYHTLDGYLVELVHQDWTDLKGYVVPALSVAAIAFVFSGDARDWFRRPVTAG